MESEVRPTSYACFFLRRRTFLTALLLYSFVACLVIMLVLNSTKTTKVHQDIRRFSVDLLNLTQKTLHDRNIPSTADAYSETDFIFSKNSRTKDAQSHKRKQFNTSTGGKAKCGNDTESASDGIDVCEHDQLHSVRRHYKSMIDLQPFDFHCDSCAVVSSSGQLLNQKAGRQIDSHSCVLRMNVAPTKGFEMDVGFKTTVRIICFISTAGLKAHASELLSGAQQAERYLFWGLNAPTHKDALGRVQMLAKGYDAEFYSLDDEGDAEAVSLFEKETGKNRAKTNSWLSTGWFTMMLAIDMCDEIHVYGMVPEDYCRKYGHRHVKYHYWQNSWGPSECDYYKANEYTIKGGHRFITEKAIFQRWGLKYNITFHYPGWNLEKRKKLGDQLINTPFMRRETNKEQGGIHIKPQ